MFTTIIVTLSVSGLLFAQDFEYVGVDKCKMCHKKHQYSVWENGPHAGALETLKSETSAKIAKDKGIEVPAYEASECLVCHTTGYDSGGYEVMDAKFWDQKTEKGKATKEVKRMTGLQSVSCETCHGPGSKYKSATIMSKKKYAKNRETQHKLFLENGGIMPTEEVCISCHNEKSPTYKEFKFEEKVKEIVHPYPIEDKK